MSEPITMTAERQAQKNLQVTIDIHTRNGTKPIHENMLMWVGVREVSAILAELDAMRVALKESEKALETERMRLAACGVVAMSNTPESAAKNREMHEDYRSASCGDVARAVDREMALRARLAECRSVVAAAVEEVRTERDPMGLLGTARKMVRDSVDALSAETRAWAAGEGE